jgi:predicted nuclease of predicted toxin-antitoxin system
MKLIVDMNLSPRWSSYLSNAGFSAVHWSEVGKATAPDTAIMSFARENDYVVFTHDLDFGAILAVTQGEKPSVVQLRSDELQPEKIGKSVIAALIQMTSELEIGALLTIEPQRIRLKLLPLRRS